MSNRYVKKLALRFYRGNFHHILCDIIKVIKVGMFVVKCHIVDTIKLRFSLNPI